MLMAGLLAGACSDDIEQAPTDVGFCVHAAWQNGLDGSTTRALSTTDILSDGKGDIDIDYADYPATIDVVCIDGKNFTLTNGGVPCGEHIGYRKYTPSVFYKDNVIKRDELKFTATAVIDGIEDGASEAKQDVLTGEFSYEDLKDKHMLITLHHTKALLRFAFKVDAQYDKIRYIKVTGIKLNDKECAIVEKVLNTTENQLIAYAYIDPKVVSTSTVFTLACTYNIYDKDSATDTHLTREGVVAQNKFKLGNIKDSNNTIVTEIKPGYYYDLHVTLNPDYLYVLSEHDNKHLVIN